MKKELGIIAFALGTLFSMTGVAQDTGTDNHVITIKVPNFALLDLESTVSKNFDASFVQGTPLEAGEKITDPDDNTDTWLNYSSIIPESVTSRRVNVKASVLVPGIDIKVTAAASTTGFGTKGSSAGEITLTLLDQEIISGIGSAYTATGASKGHKLTYSFDALDASYGDLRAKDTPVTVTYTLADN